MSDDGYLPFGIALIALIWLLVFKESRGRVIALTLVLAFGLFAFGLGIIFLNNAGAINAILTFESAREPMLQASYGKLNATLQPNITVGMTNLVFGTILLTFGLLNIGKKSRD